MVALVERVERWDGINVFGKALGNLPRDFQGTASVESRKRKTRETGPIDERNRHTISLNLQTPVN